MLNQTSTHPPLAAEEATEADAAAEAAAAVEAAAAFLDRFLGGIEDQRRRRMTVQMREYRDGNRVNNGVRSID